MYSDDDGATWSQPVDLTPQVKDPSWQAMFAASGTDIQTSRGRFLVPLVVRDAEGVIHSANAYSDDHGKTWKRGVFIGSNTDESHNVELKNHTILQNMRDETSRMIARSSDEGITFGPVEHDVSLIDPGCNAGITRYKHGKTDVLIFTNAASHRRENLTVKLSYDGGRTWPIAKVITSGPSAYSTVIPLQDGNIGILYEHGESGPYEKITFAQVSLSWMTEKTRCLPHKSNGSSSR
jgi:sialidase-1